MEYPLLVRSSPKDDRNTHWQLVAGDQTIAEWSAANHFAMDIAVATLLKKAIEKGR